MDSWPEHSEKDSGLKDIENVEKALAIIISCTRRVKRPFDLVTLVENILYAKRCMGSLEAVGEAVKLSVRQLEDFLEVEKLCAEVITLVKKRAIDSVDIVKTISKLSPKKQKGLSKYIIKGRITSKDVRIITTFAKKFPRKSIEQVIAEYEKSKDIRLYVAQFRLPTSFNNMDGIHKRFIEIVGKDEIKKLKFNKEVAVLEVTAMGYKKLREAVRKKQMTLRKFIAAIVNEIGERK
jgi:hypothetical protein